MNTTLSLLLAGIAWPILAFGQSCTPTNNNGTETDEGCPYLTKQVQYTVTFPGGYSSTVTPNGYGQCLAWRSCTGQINSVQCWPIFYAPVAAPGDWYDIVQSQQLSQYQVTCGDGSQHQEATCTNWLGATNFEVTHSCSGGEGDGGDCEGSGDTCNDDSDCCQGSCGSDNTCQSDDPIIIDLDGRGYELTDTAGGVVFDFFGNGKPVRMSWTARGWNGGFLALDRNGNGRIDDATELFSNISPQNGRGGVNANGFMSLRYYDLPANGGNGDGWIDQSDTVYDHLIVWVDLNHNGVSEPDELLSLRAAGVTAISLDYSPAKWKDAFGNTFRYKAPMKVRPGSVRSVYDVVLQAEKAPSVSGMTSTIQGSGSHLEER